MPIYDRSRSFVESIKDIKDEVQDYKSSQFSGFDVWVPKSNVINNAPFDVEVHGKGFSNGEFFTVTFDADNQSEPLARIFMAAYTDSGATNPANPDDLFLTGQLEISDSIDQDGHSEWFINFYIRDSASITDAYGKIYILSSDTGTVAIV